MKIIVYGMPAPQGSKSFKGLAGNGRAILAESSKKVKPWRQDVKAAAIEEIERRMQAERDVAARGNIDETQLASTPGLWHPFDEPLYVWMTFVLPKPVSAPRNRVTYPMRKPDLSKLIRSTEDALTDAGVWTDDARVIRCVASKVYVGEPLPDLGLASVEKSEVLSVPGAIINILTE